jgi:hypothetical protein
MLMKLLPILIITLLYGLIYAAIHRADPTAFGFENGVIDPFYFSFTTMSSVGYGDYSPKTNTAKVVVMTQQFVLIGQIIELLGLDKLGNSIRNTSINNMIKNA